MELYDKLLEKCDFDEVFFEDCAEGDFTNYSDYNTIKDSIHSRMRW
jgi:hypothetical protein